MMTRSFLRQIVTVCGIATLTVATSSRILLAQDDDPAHGFSALAGQIPLPAVRRRLLAALCLPPAEESAADNEMWG